MFMIRYLLDTNVISEPARPDPNARVVEQLEHHDGELALSRHCLSNST